MANETITGKIFTLKDPTGTYNRFPRTVMEAVYGLNTYLQNQFGALADIYMPIEGITETKPLQEFVYRACPSTIKAKSLTLDRIYGKTLAWNNVFGIVSYSDVRLGITATQSGGYVTLSGTSENTGNGCNLCWTNTKITLGHKYIVKHNLNLPTGDYLFDQYNSSSSYDITTLIWEPRQEYSIIQLKVSASGVSYNNVKGYVNIIDLTLMFGAGKEPTTVAEFNSLFPFVEAGYDAGKLISNDAESIETVGFNQWDEEMALGTWGDDGTFRTGGTHDNYIACVNKIPILPNTTYYVKRPTAGSVMLFFDAGGNIIPNSAVGMPKDSTFTSSSGAYYVVFYLNKSNYGHSTYNHDICINLSDPAKNGTYEPYRKSVMQLGLNSIKVKSHNIWDEEWEKAIYVQGVKSPDPSRIGCKTPISVLPNTDYYFNTHGYNINVDFLDENKNFISNFNSVANVVRTTPLNCRYVVFNMAQAYGATYNHDICINVSSSFNGQYEPHGILTKTELGGGEGWNDMIVGNKLTVRRKRLDMGTPNWRYAEDVSYPYFEFRPNDVKISNGFGLIIARYSNVGTIYDAGINSDKVYGRNTGYVRVRDTSYTSAESFKNAMSGVYLDYELATPIEYELAEPFVPTVKAGTTEARISPNSDGLSAPMVADMTYDAQANNDSASSQYALTAGRLLNIHKLWGQDFDGTQDVTGALTGVTSITMNGAISGLTNINSLINIANGNVGIGTTSPALKLDVHSTSGDWSAQIGTNNSVVYLGGTSGNGIEIGSTSSSSSVYLLDVRYGQSSPGSYGSRALIVRADGNVGIGIAGPQYKLDVSGTFRATGATTLGSTLSVAGNSTLDGTVRIGGSSGATLSWVSGNSGLNINKGFYSDSYITAGGVNSSSDARLKDSIAYIQKPMDTIMSLVPREWVWNEKHYLNGQKGAGLVAQEVESVLPFAVSYDTEYLSLNYNVFHAYEIAAIQELVKEVKELKAKVEQLKMR